MLRTNLATRPFYNERLVHVGLGVVAALVLLITVLNVVKVVQLSRLNTGLSARIRDDRTAATEYSRKARTEQQQIDQEELKLIVAKAEQANTLIDSRTFSWTEFFNHIEATLPPDVMLASVRPSIDAQGTRITMQVLARKNEDIQEFMEKLEATGAFDDILPRQKSINEQGLTEVTIETRYAPVVPDPPPPAAPPAAPVPVRPAPAATKGAFQ